MAASAPSRKFSAYSTASMT